MRNRRRLIAALIFSLVSPFGIAQTDSLPNEWYQSGSAPANYEMTLDTSVKRSGRSSARISHKEGSAEDFGTLLQAIEADRYRGKRLMLSGWLKTENARSAHIWMRVQSSPTLMVGFDNMGNRPVTDTTGWHRYDVVLDIPKDAIYIAFGAFLIGKGRIWIDDFDLNTVEGHVPSTNLLTPEEVKENSDMKSPRKVLKSPVNLNFEQ